MGKEDPVAYRLTDAQIAEVISSNLSDSRIAKVLGVSKRSVEYHRKRHRDAEKKQKPIGLPGKPGRCPRCGYLIQISRCVACDANDFRRGLV